MAAPAAPAPHGGDFGLLGALQQGGVIAWLTFGALVLMSVASWYVFFVKLIDQQKIIKEGRRARTSFWQSANLREAANKLDKNGAYRQIVDDGMIAQEQHTKLTDPIDQHDWMLGSLARSQGAIASKLPTVASKAPTRSRSSAALADTRCTRSGSAMMSATRMRGLSEPYGS